MKRQHGIESVSKTLKLLELLARNGGDMTVTQIAGELDCSVSSANRFLQTLQTEGFVRKNTVNGRYELTYRMYELAAYQVEHNSTVTKLVSLAHEISQKYQVSVNINSLEGSNAILLFRVAYFYNKDLDFFSGTTAPVHCTSSGKVILSQLDDETVDRILAEHAMRSFQTQSVTAAELREELRIARENGYAVCDEEYVSGVFSFSLPVCDYRGHIYAMTLIMPLKDRTRVFRKEVINELRQKLRKL